MAKRYYAATLFGDCPKAVGVAYVFDSESLRDEWVNDELIATEKVALSPQVFKKVKSTRRVAKCTWQSNPKWMSNLTVFAGYWKYD